MAFIDLAEVDAVCRPSPAVVRGAAQRGVVPPTRLPGRPGRPPRRVGPRPGRAARRHRPDGPIAMLTQLRTWGWLFNPITIYYCFDRTGTTVARAVVEVTNTPWHERAAYVLPGRGSTSRGQGDARLALPAHGPHPPLRDRRTRATPGRGVDDSGHGERVFSASWRCTGPSRTAPLSGGSCGGSADDHAGVMGDLPPGAGPATEGRALPSTPGQGRSGRRDPR